MEIRRSLSSVAELRLDKTGVFAASSSTLVKSSSLPGSAIDDSLSPLSLVLELDAEGFVCWVDCH